MDIKIDKNWTKSGSKTNFCFIFFPRLTALECSVVTMKFSDFRDSLKDLHPCKCAYGNKRNIHHDHISNIDAEMSSHVKCESQMQ